MLLVQRTGQCSGAFSGTSDRGSGTFSGDWTSTIFRGAGNWRGLYLAFIYITNDFGLSKLLHKPLFGRVLNGFASIGLDWKLSCTGYR